jgi:ubiquinone biosynthesis protein
MPNPLQRVRHIGRYRDIFNTGVRFGFEDIFQRMGLPERLGLPRKLPLVGEIADLTTPQRFRMALEALGPTFIKLGQLLSTRPDLLPPDYILELSRLQDAVPAAPWSALREQIENELGSPMGEVFDSVNTKPLGSASLAQVHAARLLTGEDVVIKVQRPGIERTIEIDLEILYDFARLLQEYSPWGEMYDFTSVAEDFRETLQNELDYRRESSYAERFRANFRRVHYVHIPTIYWDYVTRRVMVMERLYGIKIDDVEALRQAGYDPKTVAGQAVRLIIKEIMEDGFFHADPHPGNFLIMDKGIIGAMDFGQVGWLEHAERVQIIQLYIAAVTGDTDTIVSHLIRMGVARHTVDTQALRRDVTQLLNKYKGMRLEDIQFQDVSDDVMKIAFEHRLHLPADLWLLGKTLVQMEGVGSRLDPDLDLFKISEPYVKQLQRDMLSPQTWAPPILRALSEWAYLAQEAPRSTGRILKQIELGEQELVIVPKGLPDGLRLVDRAVDRLAIAILMASLIIGMALIIPTLSSATGFSWLQILFILVFIVVAVLGLWLLISMLWKRRLE